MRRRSIVAAFLGALLVAGSLAASPSPAGVPAPDADPEIRSVEAAAVGSAGQPEEITADGDLHVLSATLEGDQEVPPVDTMGSGSVAGLYDARTRRLAWKVEFAGLSSDVTGMHFHHAPAGVNGPIIIDIGTIGGLTSPSNGAVTVTAEQEAQLLAGRWYVNVHTMDNSDGEIRGQVAAVEALIALRASLDGDQEVPPVAGPGEGSVIGAYDFATGRLTWNVEFSDLSGDATGMHFHEAPPGVNGPIEVNIGVISGLESPSFGETTLGDAEEEALLDGLWYVNVHTMDNTDGEIRGQVGVEGPLEFLIGSLEPHLPPAGGPDVVGDRPPSRSPSAASSSSPGKK